ncbi:MAG TPA: NADH-quinone oxidoreductase subunit J [Bacteroidales bacterium]|jgi:NADH-quinone oxidoreductase subunit J|nr:NADH-quinone oxidoreductase subunit J [Bacteroidales bacterium]
MNTIFLIAASVAFVCSVLAITNRNAIHALLFLILSLLAISVIFYILGAPFIAALEVIVYAGAIMVLFIFVVMMLNVGNEKELEKKWQRRSMWIVPVILASVLMGVFIYAVNELERPGISREVIGPKQVGVSLFSTYLLGVEIAAIMLLAGIVGAYHLGRQKKKVIHRFLEKKREPAKILTNGDL